MIVFFIQQPRDTYDLTTTQQRTKRSNDYSRYNNNKTDQFISIKTSSIYSSKMKNKPNVIPVLLGPCWREPALSFGFSVKAKQVKWGLMSSLGGYDSM